MFATARRLPLVRPVASRRLFHASAPAFVNVGDKLPDVELVEGSPGNKVNLAKELTGKGVIIGNQRLAGLVDKAASDNCQRCSCSFLAFMLREPYPRLYQFA
ncbi:hypothetical protein IG631_09830 [Alternaria alternata]|nr:hypothetical protein IG631_09830 [Alternaria alternata]